MTPELKEKHRQAILLTLTGVRPASLAVKSISVSVATLGPYKDDIAETTRELDYLSKNGLAAEATDEINKAVRRWRVTDSGVEYLQKEGLI